MNPIFLVVGTPAVGKSTTSRALAARFPKSLHIPVDDMRDMVVSGLVLPGAVWSDDLTQQINLARTSVAHMALTYHQAGFVVVIDDFWDPNHRSDYQTLLSHPHLHKILLYPGQDEAHQRNLQRSGENPARAYIDEGIQIVYQQLNDIISQLAQEGWAVVDTTILSVEAAVTTILQLTANEG
ncbi:MAG: AAA family ATPase [Chloroflexi bacterium]|nr:AAA family ATPase [Chloroflexota bacterium]